MLETDDDSALGGNCDVDVDECASDPCGSADAGGECSESGGDSNVSIHAYRCACAAGYTNGFCSYGFISEYSALCSLSDSSSSLPPYAYGSTSVTALAHSFSSGTTRTTMYSLVFRLNNAGALNLHAMFGSAAKGGMQFPAAYSFSDLKASDAPDAVCDDPWLGTCADLLLDLSDAHKYASYLAVGGDLGGDAVTSMNVDGGSWGKDTPLDVGDGAIYWKETNLGCSDARGCQVARLTVVAGSTFVAWANLQGHREGSTEAWVDRVWFSPVTGTSLRRTVVFCVPCVSLCGRELACIRTRVSYAF